MAAAIVAAQDGQKGGQRELHPGTGAGESKLDLGFILMMGWQF